MRPRAFEGTFPIPRSGCHPERTPDGGARQSGFLTLWTGRVAVLSGRLLAAESVLTRAPGGPSPPGPFLPPPAGHGRPDEKPRHPRAEPWIENGHQVSTGQCNSPSPKLTADPNERNLPSWNRRADLRNGHFGLA